MTVTVSDHKWPYMSGQQRGREVWPQQQQQEDVMLSLRSHAASAREPALHEGT